jgi:hypothetical protein
MTRITTTAPTPMYIVTPWFERPGLDAACLSTQSRSCPTPRQAAYQALRSLAGPLANRPPQADQEGGAHPALGSLRVFVVPLPHNPVGSLGLRGHRAFSACGLASGSHRHERACFGRVRLQEDKHLSPRACAREDVAVGWTRPLAWGAGIRRRSPPHP